MTGGKKALLIGGIVLGFLLAAGGAALWLLRERPIGPHMAVVYRLDANGYDGPDPAEAFAFMANARTRHQDLGGLRFVPVGADFIEVRVPTEANIPMLSLPQVEAILRSFGGGGLEMRIAPTVRGNASSNGSGMEISAEEANRCIAILGTATTTAPAGPGPYRWFPARPGHQSDLPVHLVTADANGRLMVLLCDDPNFTWVSPRSERWLSDARPTVDERKHRAIAFQLTAEGAARFSALTGANLKSVLALLVDGEVYSAPRIQARISDRGIITGTFTANEVNDLTDAMFNSQYGIKVLLPAVSVSYRDK
jgi:hypothetical protein